MKEKQTPRPSPGARPQRSRRSRRTALFAVFLLACLTACVACSAPDPDGEPQPSASLYGSLGGTGGFLPMASAPATLPSSHVKRLKADGTPDGSFNGTGEFIGTNPAMDALTSVAIAGGKTVVAGFVQHASLNGSLVVARFNADGTLDAPFGYGGLATITIPNCTYSTPKGVMVDSAGKIVLAVEASMSFSNRLAVVRLLPDGRPDGGFGVSGVALFTVGVATPAGIHANADGTLLVAATTSFSGMSVLKLTNSGGIDAQFGSGGWRTLAPGGVHAMFVDGSGIVLAGSENAKAVAARCSLTGVVDSTFAGTGTLRIDEANVVSYFNAVTRDSSGRYVFAGAYRFPTSENFMVMRTSAAGVRDPAFNRTGMMIMSGNGSLAHVATDVRVSGTRILFTGVVEEQSPRVIRLLDSGIIDAQFGVDGGVMLPLVPAALELDGTGRMVIAGFSPIGDGFPL